jgi:hypothetical protein
MEVDSSGDGRGDASCEFPVWRYAFGVPARFLSFVSGLITDAGGVASVLV